MLWQLWLRIVPFLTAHSALIGIRLLLSPVSSNIVLRTACCVVGIGYPIYSSFKAIEKKDNEEQEHLLTYWAVYGCFLYAEAFSDKLLSWIPLYYHIKLAILIWLQLPSTNGSKEIYEKHLRPFLSTHEPRLDIIETGAFREINNFLGKHQREIQFLRGPLQRLILGVFHVLKDIIQSSQPWVDKSIENSTSGANVDTPADAN
ncbi:HVA22-like protein k isoform X2 [Cryptomeria japonica]|nr:HVA22-like protein k isoform X2 [Cryptomeria japonica]